MRFLRRTFTAMKRWEKILVLFFTLLLCVSTVILMRAFYIENTEMIPVRGGTYIEGSVGTIRMLNPWFTVTNDVNRDITSLVFSGLQRYNPFTGQIEDDMASLSISGNNRIYTLTLRENITWHDSTPETPHFVTADDVVFTYSTIKQQGFSNPILQKNFRGVEIEKIDDRTIQFRLEKPYEFFRSNLTLGIVPAKALEGLPPNRLPEALGYNLSPIGSGPYSFKSMVETELSTEVTLELFPQFYGAKPYIERIVFRAFPDYPSLLSDLRNLDGVRHVPRNQQGKAVIPKRYQTFYYSLPQYVALFFNLDNAVLGDKNLRLALQLATDKKSVIDSIYESVIVDTPLLEFAKEDWQYQFQPNAAQGALFDSEWHLPEKIRLQHLLEIREKNERGSLRFPQSNILLETGAILTITGSYLEKTSENLLVNGIPVIRSSTGSWTVDLPSNGGSGSIAMGESALRLTESGGSVLDTFILIRVSDRQTLERLRNEQNIVDAFLKREEGGITIEDLLLEYGALRLKKDGEKHGIRMNDQGQPLKITLLTSPSPPSYPKVANEIARQWRSIGVDVTIDIPKEKSEFEQKVLHRGYDVLLFGQPLLDNLDSYPYWHSSQIQTYQDDPENPGENIPQRLDANNLSQFKLFKADALLEQIRETHEAEKRKQSLDQMREIFKQEIPSVVLYSPTYVFAISENILGVDLGSPSLHSDRFLGMHRWFRKQGRSFIAGRSWFSFLPWLLGGGATSL